MFRVAFYLKLTCDFRVCRLIKTYAKHQQMADANHANLKADVTEKLLMLHARY